MLDKGIGGSASGPQDGLINPSQFEIKSNALYPSQIEQSATRLRAMGKSVHTQVVDIDSSWGRLKAHYEAPEEERVYNLMSPAVKSARELKGTLAKVAGHLDVYASTLHGLKPRLEKLEEDANDFRAEISGGVPEERDPFDNNGYIPPEAEKKPWDEVARTRNENAALVARYQELKAEVSSAAAKCANSINELVEGGGIDDVEAVSAEEFASSPEKLPWGAPPKEDKNCLGSMGGGARDAGTVYGEMGVGLLTLVAGYNPDTGQVNDPKAKVGALRGLGDVGLSSVVAIGTLPPGFKPIREVPWVEDRVDVAASAWLEDLGYDHEAGKEGENPLQEWVDDPVATGTKSLLLVGPGLLGGGLGAGAKGVGAAGKGAKGLKGSKGAGHMPSGMRPPKAAAATNPLHGIDASIDRLGGSYPSGHGPGRVTKEQLDAVDDVPPPRKSPDAPVSNSINTARGADSTPHVGRSPDASSGSAPLGVPRGDVADSADASSAKGRHGAGAESSGSPSSDAGAGSPTRSSDDGFGPRTSAERANFNSTERSAGERIDEMLTSRGMTREEFNQALLEPVPADPAQLTPEQVALRDIRAELGAPRAGEPMQKVLTPEAYEKYLAGDYKGAQGSVTRLEDGTVMRTPKELFEGLALGYEGSPFSAADESVKVMRFRSSSDADISWYSSMGGSGKTDGWTDPYTGNGYTKSIDPVVPESTLPIGSKIDDGAEIWAVNKDGTEALDAVYLDGAWRRVQ